MMMKRKQQGISMVELMVALALGLFVVGTVMEIFLQNKRSQQLQTGLSLMQENGRFISYVLNKDIRTAGVLGCRNINGLTPQQLVNNPPANLNHTPDTIVTGHEATGGGWAPALPATINNVVAGTDVLMIRRASDEFEHPTANMTTSDEAVVTNNALNLALNDYVLISDCESADIFQVTDINPVAHSALSNTSANFSKAYQQDAELRRVEAFNYYIKDTGRTNEAGQAILALFRADFNNNEEELVEGVENMQVSYGIDSTNDGSVNSYTDANTINNNGDWDRVVSLKINLLLNSVEPATTGAQTYSFQGANFNANDNMTRRDWEIFITVRSKMQ